MAVESSVLSSDSPQTHPSSSFPCPSPRPAPLPLPHHQAKASPARQIPKPLQLRMLVLIHLKSRHNPIKIQQTIKSRLYNMIDQLFDYSHQHLLVFLTLTLLFVHSLHGLLVEGFQGEDGPRLTLLTIVDVALEDALEVADLVVELLCYFFLELKSRFAEGCDLVDYCLHFDLKTEHFLDKRLIFQQFGLDLLSLGFYQSLDLFFQLLLLLREGLADRRDDSFHVLLQPHQSLREGVICIIQIHTHFSSVLILLSQCPLQLPKIIIQRPHFPPGLKIRSLDLLLNLHEVLTGGDLCIAFDLISRDFARLGNCIQSIEQPRCLVLEITVA